MFFRAGSGNVPGPALLNVRTPIASYVWGIIQSFIYMNKHNHLKNNRPTRFIRLIQTTRNADIFVAACAAGTSSITWTIYNHTDTNMLSLRPLCEHPVDNLRERSNESNKSSGGSAGGADANILKWSQCMTPRNMKNPKILNYEKMSNIANCKL